MAAEPQMSPEKVRVLWQKLLTKGLQHGASDLYLTAGQPAFLRCEGKMMALAVQDDTDEVEEDFTAGLPQDDFMQGLAAMLLSPLQRQQLRQGQALDFSLTWRERRLRGNFYLQQGHMALVLRCLPQRVPSLREIHAPRALYALLEAGRGLILVTGSTGSGKTTTLAAFLQAVNERRPAHILTLEDPIEYVFQPDKCFISQRELGRDYSSFPEALRSALREMPDILLVGEIRDRETMTTALQAAETGLLVLGTLHARGAAEAVRRIENFYPPEEQAVVRAEAAEVLCAICAQQLLPAAAGGRVPLVEVLLREPAVCSLIRQGKYSQLEAAMMSHQQQGMQTREIALQKLYRDGLITAAVYEEERQKFRGRGGSI